MRSTSFVLALLGVAGCDQTGTAFRPTVSDVPSIQDLGELPVVFQDTLPDAGIYPGDLDGQIVYGQLGADADPSVTGGATFTFTGTGSDVCVVLDPEAVYWTRALQPSDLNPNGYFYDDNVVDDADLDLEGGLTAYYSGSPGVEIGDFDAVYTDDAGVDHEIQFNECQQYGYGNTPNVHAGRGTTEFCTINTDQRAGVSYTIVVKTFALPVEDSIADFAVGVFDGKCDGSGGIAPDECLFHNEYDLGNSSDYFLGLEDAFCKTSPSKINEYCADHLEDEKPPCYEHIAG